MEAKMSYDAVIDQVKLLPESSLEDVSKFKTVIIRLIRMFS